TFPGTAISLGPPRPTPAAASAEDFGRPPWHDSDPPAVHTAERTAAASAANSGTAPAARRGSWRGLAIGAALAVALVAAVVSTVLGVKGSRPGAAGITSVARPSPQRNAHPSTQTAGGMRFRQITKAQRSTDCASKAFGDTQTWLAAHRCTRLIRTVFDSSLAGREVSVFQAVVDFADSGAAAGFKRAADTPGGGGISDPTGNGGAGRRAPNSFSDATYASTRTGKQVRIVEVVYTHGPSTPGEPELRRVAGAALALPAPTA
ncbi:MAG: hypothetical protein ACRDRL_31165, partial [Sciscionella sp.]